MTDPKQLLREYVESSSNAAFRELVHRYIDLVYSVALRRTNNDTRIAEDIAQTVFTDLSHKASTLPPDVMLGGWLHRHTCYTAANAMRGEQRRTAREQQALEMNMLHEDSEENWKQLAPVLDDAIQELAPAERDAVVLRFFEQRDFRSVGAALGVSDDAAQKRVSRALEKLRELLVRRGVTMGVVALGTALADRSIYAAPVGLGSTVANSVEHQPAAMAVRKSKPVARIVGMTAVVASLLVVLLHPEVSGKLSSWLGTGNKGEKILANSVATEQPATLVPDTINANPLPTNSFPNAVQASATATINTNVLTLTIVADDSGKPVPNVPVEVRGVAGAPKVTANRMGIAEVPFFEKTSYLQLTTQIDGFADTRLFWNLERGQAVPSSYTLRLVRPVQIGGKVIGPDNEPVAGAKVGFNHREDPLPTASVESHNFSWIEVTTDSDGRWQINRIAPEIIRRIYGSAKHPDYANSSSASLDEVSEIGGEVETALKNGTHIFKLGKAMGVRGVVQDAEHNPIEGAKVLCGEKQMSGSRETKSTADGTFIIKGMRPGKTVLTAEAEGFAATTIPIEITGSEQSFTLTLVPGKTLRMRVVNTKGEPIAKANVWLKTMSHTLPKEDKGKVPVQATFDKRTDEEGRVIWENAPDTEHTFDISGRGCMRLNNVKMRPSEEEHVVTLQPALLVSGTVKDADTGKDIPKFRVICGWPGQDGPHWSNFDRDWLTFEGGAFKHSFGDPMIHGMENPGYQLKIEAEGYTTYVSRAMKPTEGEVNLEISLKPARTPLITVLLPDGEPATLADVGFVAPKGRLEMMPGGFNRQNVQNAAALSQTDRQGQFRLPGDEEISHVVIAHPKGCAERTPNDLMNSSIVYLQPWGRLEGIYRSGNKAIEGRQFTLQFGFAESDAIQYSFSKRVTTDADGKFVFPQLLPGRHKLIMLIHQKVDERSGSFQHREMQEVEIESGQTTTVELGGPGHAVQLKLQFPPGTNRRGISVMAAIHTEYPRPPKEIMKDQNALKAWRETPEISELLKRVKHVPFMEQPDGTWVAENVSPGEYSVMINAHRRAEDSKTMETWHGGKADVTISEESSTSTLDLGEIVLQTPAQLQR